MSKKLKMIILIAFALFLIILCSGAVKAETHDVCFIGDSFIEGLEMYSELDADFYGYRGITTGGVLKKDLIRKNLSNKEYKRVYVLLGINEVCNNDPATFCDNYVEIIEQITELQPDADITLMCIFHTTMNKSNNSEFKNERIDKYNYYIWYISCCMMIGSMDYNRLYDNGNGTAMFSDYSKDGVHLKPQYYYKWAIELNDSINHLKEKTNDGE